MQTLPKAERIKLLNIKKIQGRLANNLVKGLIKKIHAKPSEKITSMDLLASSVIIRNGILMS